MTVTVNWKDGETNIYHHVDSICKEFESLVLVSNTIEDNELWAEKIKSIQVSNITE